MVTINISIMLVGTLFGFLFRDKKFSLFDSGARIGVIVGVFLGVFVGVTLSGKIPAKFEERIISFPLEKVQHKADSVAAFLGTKTIEGEEYYIFYYYGENGILNQNTFLTKNVLIKPNCDTAKVEIKKFSRNKNATINYFSIQDPPDPEIIIYLPSCPIE